MYWRIAVGGWEHTETGGRGEATPLPEAALRRPYVVTRSRPYPRQRLSAQRETGDRMDGGGRNTFRSQVSATRSLVRVFRCRYRISVICPFRVAGGSLRWRVAGNLPSVLCHRFSPQRSPQLSPPSVSPNRQPLSANRHHLLHLLAFPTPTPIPTPFPSLPHHVLPLHSSPSRRPDAP
jgi:hypothetical protein